MVRANPAACIRVSRPAGSGRLHVRVMRLSLETSYSWFSVFAHADAPKVPKAVQPRPAQSMLSPLPATKPPADVRTTRAESLNLESSL